MQLYKIRSFNDYFSDTITFFKATGKHYFRNYFIINGGFLMILSFLFFMFGKIYFDLMFSSIASGTAPDENFILSYVSDNAVMLILLCLLLVIVSLVLSLLNLTFPVVYMRLTDVHGPKNFDTATIVKELKSVAGRMFKFSIGLIFIITPMFVILFTVLILLAFIIIGIPMMIILMPAAMAWLSLTYHDYIIKRSGFFNAMGSGLSMLRQKFWPITFATLLFYLIVQMLQGTVMMVPYVVGLISFFTGAVMDGQEGMLSGLAIFLSSMMVLGVFVTYTLNNLVIVGQGMIYYGLREENENRSASETIDEIGQEY